MTAICVSQRQAASHLGCGLTYFRARVLPELRVVRMGGKLLIPVRELEDWVDRHASSL